MGNVMSEATFTFRVEESLKNEFATAAKARDRTGAQLLRVRVPRGREGDGERGDRVVSPVCWYVADWYEANPGHDELLAPRRAS